MFEKYPPPPVFVRYPTPSTYISPFGIWLKNKASGLYYRKYGNSKITSVKDFPNRLILFWICIGLIFDNDIFLRGVLAEEEAWCDGGLEKGCAIVIPVTPVTGEFEPETEGMAQEGIEQQKSGLLGRSDGFRLLKKYF